MSAKPDHVSAKPDYGIDAPGVIRSFLFMGIVLLLVFVFFAKFLNFSVGPARFELGSAAFWMGIFFLAESLLMLLYAKWGKFRHRERLLGLYRWRGDEQVLDVGTGRGLLLVGAARRLTTGRAVGIDIWKKSDLSGNSIARTVFNLAVEGVTEKTDLKSEDVRRMSFPDATFDLVVSNLCLHNIASAAGREKACEEMIRVLRPGGVAIISDFKNVRAYAAMFRRHGFEVQRHGPYLLDTFPPLWAFKAQRAGEPQRRQP